MGKQQTANNWTHLLCEHGRVSVWFEDVFPPKSQFLETGAAARVSFLHNSVGKEFQTFKFGVPQVPHASPKHMPSPLHLRIRPLKNKTLPRS